MTDGGKTFLLSKEEANDERQPKGRIFIVQVQQGVQSKVIWVHRLCGCFQATLRIHAHVSEITFTPGTRFL